jgi:hypothetical protein
LIMRSASWCFAIIDEDLITGLHENSLPAERMTWAPELPVSTGSAPILRLPFRQFTECSTVVKR